MSQPCQLCRRRGTCYPGGRENTDESSCPSWTNGHVECTNITTHVIVGAYWGASTPDLEEAKDFGFVLAGTDRFETNMKSGRNIRGLSRNLGKGYA